MNIKSASSSYSIRTAVGGAFLIIALSTCSNAMAQDGEQLFWASALRVAPPDFLSSPSDTASGDVDSALFIKEPTVDGSPTASLNDDQDAGFNPSFDTGFERYFRPVGYDRLDCKDDFAGCSDFLCNPCLCCNPCPCFYGMVEGLFLTRQPLHSRQTLVNDQTTNTTLLSTSNLNFNYNPGLRARVGFGLPGGRAMEFSYLGLFSGTANASVVKPDPGSFLTFQDNLTGNVFVGSDRVDVNYSSWFNSFALNFACCCGGCVSTGCGDTCGAGGCGAGGTDSGCGQSSCQSVTWFSGFRYIDFGERFNMTAQKTIAMAPENGSYNIRTANHLYGAQLGARIRQTWGRFGWEGSGAAGIYLNNAQQSQSVTDFPNFPLRNASSSSNSTAFLGDANLSGIYRLNNIWNLRAGYNVIWIEGLALAPNQLDTNFAAAQGGRNQDNSGGMLLHGVNFGIEARY